MTLPNGPSILAPDAQAFREPAQKFPENQQGAPGHREALSMEPPTPAQQREPCRAERGEATAAPGHLLTVLCCHSTKLYCGAAGWKDHGTTGWQGDWMTFVAATHLVTRKKRRVQLLTPLFLSW